MTRPRPVTPSADRTADMPATPHARIEHIDRALHSLGDELTRLERLGLGQAIARCRAERRYWSFLAAIHGLANADSPALTRCLSAWLAGEVEVPVVSPPRPRAA